MATSCIPLTLYMRQGCHLCEDMQNLLHELLEPQSFSLELVDIDTEPGLKSKFNEWVPVLAHGERQICHHFLDLKALREAQARYNTLIDG